MLTLDELRQKYPIGKTYIGSYYMDEVFYPDRILNDEEYRLKDYSITKMAELENCSEATISREIKKLKNKISKVL